jgi:Uncharacterised nucleotidyltransferase
MSDAAVYRALLREAWSPEEPSARQWSRDLSCPNLDWDRLTTYLTACGLAGPLVRRLKGPQAPRWAPSFLAERLQTRAHQDGVFDLAIKPEILRRIASELGDLGTRGVLLKGTALLVLQAGCPDLPPHRATGDIDLYVEPTLASRLRRRLLEKGFSGTADDSRTAPHHLAPVHSRGIAVEIHERIMPGFWGLPEREMIAHAQPVDGMAPLYTLNPAGLLLHAGVHASANLFSHGMKTAWDMVWIYRRFPDLNWDQLASWVRASRLPRSFWVPIRVLSREVSIPLPQEVLRQAPGDKHQFALEMIACDRLFSTVEGAFELNPFAKTWFFMALHHSWSGRIRYLTALLEPSAIEARRTAMQHQPAQSRHQMWRHLREAIAQWRLYRRSFGARSSSENLKSAL